METTETKISEKYKKDNNIPRQKTRNAKNHKNRNENINLNDKTVTVTVTMAVINETIFKYQKFYF